MDWEDIAAFATVVLFLCCTWLAVYLTLRSLDWNRKIQLFRHSGLIWLTWLVSSLVIQILSFAFFFVGNALLYFAGLMIVNTLTIAIALRILARREITPDIFGNEIEQNEFKGVPNIWRTSFLVNTAAIFTTITLIGAFTAVGFLIEKVHPRPKDQFEIYDI